MKKIIALVIVMIVCLPLLPSLIPKARTIERVEAAYIEAGYTITDLRAAAAGNRESAESWTFRVDGYRVEVFRYDSEGKIAKHVGNLQQDVGSAFAASMNLREQFGAAPDPNLPSVALRKGKWMVHVVGEDRARCQALANILKKS